MLAHYAVGPGSDEIRARYHRDPTTDYHAATVDIVQGQTGITLERKPAKNLNFGLVYGMGRDKVVRSLDLSEDLGNRLYDAYFEAMPFVKRTYKSAERLAKRRGYIKTILGRRRRFGPDDSTHKALNACLQGSAADVIKKAMAECDAAGVFDYTGIPHLTVHDELDWSDDGSKEAQEAFAEAERIMASCVPVRVPLLVDMSSGAHWGDCL
jgi:DNA polymerase I-like protein with 3'-5' exonuclease and polymerase domains